MKNIFPIFLLLCLGIQVFCQQMCPPKVIIAESKMFKYTGSKDGYYCQISVFDLAQQQVVTNTINFVALIDTFGPPQWDVDSNRIFMLRLGYFNPLPGSLPRCGILEYKIDKFGSIVFGHPIDRAWLGSPNFGELYEIVIPNVLPIDQITHGKMIRPDKIVANLKSRDFFVKKGKSFFTLVDDPIFMQTRLWEYYGEKTPHITLQENEGNIKYRANRELWKEIFTISSKNEDAPVMAYPKGDDTYVITQSKDLYLIGETTQNLGTITKDLSELTIVVNKDKGSVGFCRTTVLETWLKDTKQPLDVRPLEELIAQ